MNPAFILDCSLAMAWLFGDESTAATRELLDRLETEAGVVPALWFLEVTNVIAIAERTKRITTTDSDTFISKLSRLPLEIDAESPGRAFDDLLPLCRAHRLTSYDAVYLELARRRSLPLATLDAPLRKVGKKLGIKLLGK